MPPIGVAQKNLTIKLTMDSVKTFVGSGYAFLAVFFVVHGEAIVSQQIEHKKEFWHQNCLIWESKEAYLYLRTTADKRIMLGGRDEKTNNPRVRQDKLELKTQQLADDFAKLFPKLRFQPEYSWSGTFGVAKDGLPYIGHYEHKPNGLFSLGFGGDGITFSVIAAEIIRDILLGKS